MAVLRVVIFAFLLLAISHSQTVRGPVLDQIIRDALEKARPKLKDLEIPPQEFNMTEAVANITATFEKGLVTGLDKFAVTKLTTTLIPLKVTNFTMALEEVNITGVYSLNGSISLSGMPGNLTIFGEGDLRVTLKGMLFTIAGDFGLVNGKLQVLPKGLHGFDFYLSQCEVELKNLLGGGKIEEIVNKFIGFFITDVVRDYKKTFFEMARDPLIKYINDALAK